MRIAYLSSRGDNPYDIRFLNQMVDRGIDAHLISYYDGQLSIKIDGIDVHHYPRSLEPLQAKKFLGGEASKS